MKHGKLFILLLALCAAFSVASAQITIGSNNIPSIGYTYTGYSTGEGVTVNPGPSGANQNWTIPDYTWQPAHPFEFVSPGSTPFSADFPTATFATQTLGRSEDGTTYYRTAQNGIYLQGFAYALDTAQYIIVYNPEGLFVPLPLSYPHANWTSVFRFTQELFPGFVFTTIDSIIHTLDGWGNLNLPFTFATTIPALRDFQHQWVTVIPPFGQPTINESVAYSWMGQNGVLGATISSEDGDTSPNFTIGSVSVNISGATAVDPARGPVADNFKFGQNYPNPFNPNTNLPLELTRNTKVTLDIYDETGRLVSSESMELSAGQHTLPVDGSNWSSGNYFARLTAGEQSLTQKMKLIK